MIQRCIRIMSVQFASVVLQYVFYPSMRLYNDLHWRLHARVLSDAVKLNAWNMSTYCEYLMCSGT